MTDTPPAPPTDPQAERDRPNLNAAFGTLTETAQFLDTYTDRPDLAIAIYAVMSLFGDTVNERDDLAGQVTRLTEERDEAVNAPVKLYSDGYRNAEARAEAAEAKVATLTARVQRLETALRAELDCLPESSWAKSSTYQRLAAALGDA